ncbi:MAG: hypothetical protein IPM55_19915 [Acidobacteria bacterium]|nr:hypothetical protein [Acidobacteriota bacterium]
MPKTGHFILHSNVIPTVTAGRYELVTDQTGLPFTVAAERTHVIVASPRYTMPTDQILSTFPPANAEGAFGDRLPQIVLKRRTLPWERNPEGVATPSSIPWLAMVVVAEGEAQLSSATPVAQCVTEGTKLLDAATDKDVEQGLYLAVTETVVKKIFPCKQDLELMVHVREVNIDDTELANGDDDGWLAVVLANRLPVFDEANKKPVRYMACLVNLEGQLDALPPPEPPVDHFNFALAQDWRALATIDPRIGPDPRVMGGNFAGNVALPAGARASRRSDRATRAPNAAIEYRAPRVGSSIDGAAAMNDQPVSGQWSSATQHVNTVALDPDAKRLVRDGMAIGFRLPIELFAREKVLRFPVLAHWSFTTNEGATFESLMRDLDVSLLGSAPAETPSDAELVQTGHIGLDHRSRRGDRMRAWYRGPCVPFPTKRDQSKPGEPLEIAHSADQLRRVVPDGREDLSYAAAFEIGRLLALSQLSIVSALMRFRSEQFGAGRIRRLLEEIAAVKLPSALDASVDLSRFVALGMMDEMVINRTRIIGPRRPIADPGRPLDVRGDLDEIIATGLGLDLAAIRKTGDRVGIMAALEQTIAPVASKDGRIEINKQTVLGLNNGLRTELGRVLEVAAPAPVIRAGRRRGAAPQADSLDALIEDAIDDEEEL